MIKGNERLLFIQHVFLLKMFNLKKIIKVQRPLLLGGVNVTSEYKKGKFVLVISEHLPIIKDQLKLVSYKTMPSMNGLH